MEERTFYKDQNVLVTQSRFVSNGKTFAMQNISSVSINKISKNSTRILGGVILLLGIFCVQAYPIFGIILICLSILMFFLVKDDFAVSITSNSGEENVLVSKNKEYIQKIVDAISEAIIHRG